MRCSIAFGTIWFVLMLLPSVSMLILDVGEPMAEQRALLAGAGFAIGDRRRMWPGFALACREHGVSSARS